MSMKVTIVGDVSRCFVLSLSALWFSLHNHHNEADISANKNDLYKSCIYLNSVISEK